MWNIMIVVVVVVVIIIIIIVVVVVVVVIINIPSVINGNTVEENEEEDDEEERDGKARLEIPAWLGTLNENWQYSNNGTHVGDKIAFGNCLASMTRSISLLEWTPCLETRSLRGSQQQTTPIPNLFLLLLFLTLPPPPPHQSVGQSTPIQLMTPFILWLISHFGSRVPMPLQTFQISFLTSNLWISISADSINQFPSRRSIRAIDFQSVNQSLFASETNCNWPFVHLRSILNKFRIIHTYCNSSLNANAERDRLKEIIHWSL